MIILGLDPGFATIGFGVIESEKGKANVIDYGTITTSKDLTFPERLMKIEKGMIALIEKFKPEQIAMEELFFNTNITTGINVAHARGVMVLFAARECRIYPSSDKTSPHGLRQSGQATDDADGKNVFEAR